MKLVGNHLSFKGRKHVRQLVTQNKQQRFNLNIFNMKYIDFLGTVNTDVQSICPNKKL